MSMFAATLLANNNFAVGGELVRPKHFEKQLSTDLSCGPSWRFAFVGGGLQSNRCFNAQTPTASLKGLRVYLTEDDAPPVEPEKRQHSR
jgi:hypothetical protein